LVTAQRLQSPGFVGWDWRIHFDFMASERRSRAATVGRGDWLRRHIVHKIDKGFVFR
jgi:hypothetical protein